MIKGSGSKPKHKLYMKYHCSRILVDLFGTQYQKQKAFRNWIIGVNICIVIAFIVHLYFWGKNEKLVFRSYVMRTPLPSDYALQIKGLPQNMTSEELERELVFHFYKYHKDLETGQQLSQPVCDINLQKNNNLLDVQKKISTAEERIKITIGKMAEKGVFGEMLNSDNLNYDAVYSLRKRNSTAFGTL